MKTKTIISVLALLALLSTLNSQLSAAPLGTAFTYQGKLSIGPGAVTGSYDFSFSLWGGASGGGSLGTTNLFTALAVTNGVFTVTLDFGAGAFGGDARWLEIGVRTNGSGGGYHTVPARQALLPAPQALWAQNAGTAADGAVSASSLNTAGAPTAGQVLAYDGSQLAWTNPSSAVNAWGLTGNAGTAGGNFLGTTDNQALELRVNNNRALRLESNTNLIVNPAANSAATYASSVLGGDGNNIGADSHHAVISGGGYNGIGTNVFYAGISSGGGNKIGDSAGYSVIAGGHANEIDGGASVIAGGSFGIIGTNSDHAVISGGMWNSVGTNASCAIIAGGYANTISGGGSYSSIGGGGWNAISNGAYSSAIGGGVLNSIGTNAHHSVVSGGGGNSIGTNADHATISGGRYNSIGASAAYAFIGCGSNNVNEAALSVIVGGECNQVRANADHSSIGGGANNAIEPYADHATISGGYTNAIQTNAYFSTIGGGCANTVEDSAVGATIAGGYYNLIQYASLFSTIGGGYGNTIEDGDPLAVTFSSSTIAGGEGNTIQSYAYRSIIGGGYTNAIQTEAAYATIDGGVGNTIQTNAQGSAIGGGAYNTVQNGSVCSTIAGGYGNWIQEGDPSMFASSAIGGGLANSIQAFAICATIPGGFSNSAASYAFAAGNRARANHTGAFVWGDSTDADVSSSANDQFTVRASGGARFFSSSGLTAGVVLNPGSGSWSSVSDRAAKENVHSVDPRQVLQRLAELPLATWNYKAQEPSIRHIGPMAQDFRAAFEVGEDEQHITTIDADGVALAAIQGLNQKLEAAVKAKDAEIESLKQRLERLEGLLTQREGEGQ